MTPQPYLILSTALSSSRRPRRGEARSSLPGVPCNLREALEQGEVFILGIVRLPTRAPAATKSNSLSPARRRRLRAHPAEEVRGRRELQSTRFSGPDLRHRVWQIVVQKRFRVGGSKTRLPDFGRRALHLGGVQRLGVHGIELGEYENRME